MKELKRILIMAGGTGGHVFPGLTIAHYFREKGIEVHWLGTMQGIESKVVPEAGFSLHFISVAGLRGKGIKSMLLAPIKIGKSILQARRLMNEIRPDVVIGMGGYASGPGGVAAWLTGRPLIIHEQNAKMGLTNKLLTKVANRVLAGFPIPLKPQSKVLFVGNPVRIEIENLPAPSERFTPSRSPFRLLVLGGSLGARALNEMVPRALAKMHANNRPLVMHQTGDKYYHLAKETYQSVGVAANLIPFVKNMAEAYGWADMVLCRAGALTVTELCTVGLGAIFVPYPYAVDDHQTANAHFMVKDQAALCIQESELTETRLAEIVTELSTMPQKSMAMAQAAYRLRQVNVAEKIYHICKEIYH